jgi:tRNA-(ms[2]io[6]A)-hydroxylase
LIAGLIEARSCERFKLLSERLSDPELAGFYARLMASEAHHYTLFLRLARKYGQREVVDRKWEALLAFEAEVMQSLSSSEQIHG